MSAARTIKWMLWAIGLGLCAFGVVRAFQSIGLMLESRPTGSSLTLATGMMSFVIGLAIFGLAFLFRGRKPVTAEKISDANPPDSA